MVLLVARPALTSMFGATAVTSVRLWTFCVCSCSALSAVTAIGTFCKSSDRRRAVTTTSCRVPAAAAAVGGLAVASGSAAAAAPAAIKQYEINAGQNLGLLDRKSV